jgi:hypothetical protein
MTFGRDPVKPAKVRSPQKSWRHKQDVIAHLPSEFELDGEDVARWLNDRLAWALRDEARASL